MHISPAFSAPRSLIARTQELTLFRSCLEEAATGVGSLLLLAGEIGVGKTTLAEHMLREAQQHQMPILVGRGSDLLRNVPYGIWLSALTPQDPSDHPLAPVLQSPESSAPTTLFTLFRRFETWLRDASTRKPLIVMVDDLHEADTSSLDLLRLLAQHLAALPVVFLLTYRLEALAQAPEASRCITLLAREPRTRRVLVRPFHQEEVAVLLRDRYHLPPGDLRRLLSYLQEHAVGNPLYFTELLHMLEEHELFQREDEKWNLRDLPEEQVPPLLHQLLAERMRQITPEEHRLLQLAAVIGPVVPLALWQTIGQVSAETLWQVCENGLAQMVLDALPGKQVVQFHHPLIRQVLLETLLLPRRRRWHQQIAEELLAQEPSESDAIAFHFHEARDPRALPWLRRAAEQAFQWGAALTAANLYEQMLHEAYTALLSARERAILQLSIGWLRRGAYPQRSLALTEQVLQVARGSDDTELVFYTLGCRAFIFYHLNAMDAMAADAQEAVNTWQALTSQKQLAGSIELPNPHGVFEAFDLFGGMLYLLAQNGYYQQVLTLAEPQVQHPPACEMPETTPPRFTLAFALLYGALAPAYNARGKIQEAQAAYAHSRRCFDEVGLYFATAISAQHELVWHALPYLPEQAHRCIHLSDLANQRFQQDLGFFLDEQEDYARLPLWYSQGRWKEARPLAETLAASTEAERAAKGVISGFLGLLTFHQGDYDRAWELIRAALPAGVESIPGQHHFFGTQMLQRLAVQLLCEEGQLDEARRWLEAHDRWLAWAGCVLGQAEGQLLWTSYYRRSQDHLRASACAQEALRLATQVRQPLIQLAAHRLLTLLARESCRLREARTHLGKAQALADACACPYERALTLLEGAELERAEHHLQQARARAAQAEAIFQELQAQPALARCHALIAQVTGHEEAAGPAKLTAREREIVSFVAQGCSNQQIARQLSLSPGTVKRHLYNISQKLEARNRTQVVTIARQHGWLA